MQPCRVLIADNRPERRNAIVDALKCAGAELLQCTSACAALEQLAGLDCAFVGDDLPPEGGVALLVTANRNEIATPVVILQAGNDQAAEARAIEAGAADVLTADAMTPQCIRQSLRHAIRIRQLRRQTAEVSERLRADEERLNRLVETIADGVLILDTDGHYIFANHAAERLLGVSAEQITQFDYHNPPWRRTWTDGSHMADDAHPFAQVMRTGRPVAAMEIAVWRTDGQRVVLSLSAAPLRDSLGAIDGVVATMRDVTQARAAEDAVRKGQHFIQQVVNTTPDLIYIYDLIERSNVYTNRQITEVLGYTPHQVQQMGPDLMRKLVHPNDAARVAAHHGRLVRANDNEVLEIEYRMQDAKGNWRWLCSRDVVFSRTPEGVARQIIGTALDISQRKQFQEALRDTNQRLEGIINSAPLAICAIDPDAKVSLWNPAAERIFGWTAAEAIGGPLPFIPPDKQAEFDALRRRVLAEGWITGLELQRRRKDGTPMDISLSTAPVRDAGGNIILTLAMIEDITETKRMKERLLQAHRMESIGRLAGGVAHEFNNLLAVISGYSESLLRHMTPDSPLISRVIEIERAAQRGAALTRQLLSFGRRPLGLAQVVDLNQMIKGVQQMLRNLLSEKIQIVTRPHAGRAIVRGDPGQIEQALVNLALNARDAMPEGGALTIAIEAVELAPALAANRNLQPGKYIKLSVADTGCGMDEAVRAHIFEPFFTTKEGKGTGLGLSIVYEIVQQCGGEISVSSAPGQGTTFELLLPRAMERDNESRCAEAK